MESNQKTVVVKKFGSIDAVVTNAGIFSVKPFTEYTADDFPGVVDSPLPADDPKEFLKRLSPTGSISAVQDIASAVVYLTEARQITGEVLHVDGGAHKGKW
jgi:NAD(P)-dependent dehydrogenase (short-subunit alcohol dehydrogenase family)